MAHKTFRDRLTDIDAAYEKALAEARTAYLTKREEALALLGNAAAQAQAEGAEQKTGAGIDLKKRLARILVEKSYKEGSFLLASGRRSDYYFDCRVTALDAEGAWLIGSLFYALIAELRAQGVEIKGVGGMTMGADPLVSATTVISWEKGQPLEGLLVRKEAKGHGTNQFVEGLANLKAGDPVVVLEDVVTTGGSLLKACQRIELAGLKIVAVCAILDREEGGRDQLKEHGYELRSLFTRKELLEHARS